MSRLLCALILVLMVCLQAGEVPGFNILRDTPSFPNFTLSEMKIWSIAEKIAKTGPTDVRYFESELKNMFKNFPATYFKTNCPDKFNLPGAGNSISDPQKSAILESMGYAHCWGMAYVTKMFFEHATFSGRRIPREQDLQSIIDDVTDGYDKNVPAASLHALSLSNEGELKKSVAYWQSRLLFNPLNLPMLFNGNPEREFGKIESSVNSQRLTLIQIRKSIKWMHVILAYKTEQIENGDTLIHVYDSNYPNSDQNILTYCRGEQKFVSAQYGDVNANFLDN
ncbi:MAG: hypothetical protein PHW04_05530 [Candidatus Wallbacteria bacterium]|nr:hypothetical protein [Candidatus Wallbacteria bacterium]